MTTEEAAREVAERGANLLDLVLGYPDWDEVVASEIMHDNFDLSDVQVCVLGHVFREKAEQEDWTSGFSVGDNMLADWAYANQELLHQIDGDYRAREYGFNIPSCIPECGMYDEERDYECDCGRADMAYADLDRAWISLIADRLEARQYPNRAEWVRAKATA